MCGIAGLFCPKQTTTAEPDALTGKTTSSIAHRGPDANGILIDGGSGVGFGQRRLLIIDLTAAGAQPMTSADKRWIAVYNGELNNTEDLRAGIEASGHRVNWRGHSDTEVNLEAVKLWGVVEAIKKSMAFLRWPCGIDAITGSG